MVFRTSRLFENFSRLHLSLVLIGLASGPAVAASLDLNGLLPEGSQYAVLVQPLAGNAAPLYEHDSDLLLPPASTQKVITALAARLILPQDFRFTTSLEQVGEDLVIRFSGDPTLTREDLQKLLTQYKQQQGKEQPRNVWLDDSAFTGVEHTQGLPWDNMGSCYSAPNAAVTLDRNCVYGAIYSDGEPGKPTRVNVPANQPIRVRTTAPVVTVEEIKATRCYLALSPYPDNQYLLSGCLGKRKEPLPLKFAVQNPTLFTLEVLENQLKQLGIKPAGEIKIGKPEDGAAKSIASHLSAPLPNLMDQMLKRSDNLIADNLFKTLGGHYYNQPGSFANASAAVKEVLKEKAGIDLSRAILRDGSGLSRDNRVSARQLTEVIRYIGLNDKDLQLLALFPVSGVSGTLTYHRGLTKPPLKGKLVAKTGTLFGTKNLAGILTTAKGNRLLVTQFVTNYFPSKADGSKKSIVQFEQRLYEGLYQGQ
ncbi:MAG: D-alanyl-D-alanine carboxypeptidase/D-alanyl-D-alanine-endopeptidase [Gammaproteobacteria bacterium]|nr:D-alanyl-D-alanine carboxypeptidase/D-alanyl-D-alanine-endopeptidase [Gammaproteobacteria bacterium]MBU1655278.1 D-alanyl-D-alanine carboxypeptidase/D-alanyl-D-alanine-endopeptidase [Gammaproteobacteria bacterium]MBU1962057.1 D-alanyl-D-alanine carboxypeptidase/D-alanyl-D-alanine-endopeptidase [Gammaproteobacteria bacterium]